MTQDSGLAGVVEEPWRFDVFAVLRELERKHPDLPRIGDAAALREEYARLGQDPYMDFPASTLSKFEPLEPDGARILTKFLGFLGPQGALSLATTEEAYGWLTARDDAFPAFPRHPEPSLPAIVFPRLGGCAADRAA